MNVVNQYITFLKEYKKLLERGVKDVLSKTISTNFIWIDDINELVDSKTCESNLSSIFTNNFSREAYIFTLQKPYKPNIIIPTEYIGLIEFDEAKNKFQSINNLESELLNFQNSEIGKAETEKIKRFSFNKSIYSKFYRAFSDIKNDTNLEIVLSIGLIQFCKKNSNNNLSKTNQHLFHFPLNLFISNNNEIKLSFSETENPYSDFFFLNNSPIEKEALTNVIDTFESKIIDLGFEYIYDSDFEILISKFVQKISDNSEFQNSVLKPNSDLYKEDFFKVTYSPAINIKQKKPRFFEKLTDSIIEYNNANENKSELLNLLLRNPEISYTNSLQKSNYFIDELYEKNKQNAPSLNAEEDFSVFFPLPYNKEQKQIYENYLKNRLTVVTGPPGTGKSHTIVNVLCSLLAQGKRILVTAQTDKALESLLEKIPVTFDDLIFTKIQLETNKNRFSLEGSINKIASILQDNLTLNIEAKFKDLNILKSNYVQKKKIIITALEKEYDTITLNENFKDLKTFQIVEKIEKKEISEWNWIKDKITTDDINNFEKIKANIISYRKLIKHSSNYKDKIDFNISNLEATVKDIDFANYLSIQNLIKVIISKLDIQERHKEKLLNIDLTDIVDTLKAYSNFDLKLRDYKHIEGIQSLLKPIPDIKNITTNITFSNLVANETKYLLDIETYLSYIKEEKVSFYTKQFDSKFKSVSYLENITINGTKSNTKQNILKLKEFIKCITIINSNLQLLNKNGYIINYDDKADIESKKEILDFVNKQVETNKELIYKLQKNQNIINFSGITNIDRFEIEKLIETAIDFKDDVEKLKKFEFEIKKFDSRLIAINNIIEKSKLKEEFNEFIPIQNISEKYIFESFFF